MRASGRKMMRVEKMSWGNVMSYSTDASVDLDTGLKGRKAEREMKRGWIGRPWPWQGYKNSSP